VTRLQGIAAFHTLGKPSPCTPPGFVSAAAQLHSLKGFQFIPSRAPMCHLPPISLSDMSASAGRRSSLASDASSPTPEHSGGASHFPTVHPKLSVASRSGSATGHPLFCPPLFLDDASSTHPSHRMLWFQHGRVTLLIFVDFVALFALDGTRAVCFAISLSLAPS
jgi:hypothetical protein